ncbi:MAG: DUF4444 domain-containing protein [Pseudomonadota bacterium]
MSLDDLTFPPLFRGEAAPTGVDPFAKAISTAALGCDPGLIVHNTGGDDLAAALVLAPDAPLADAMAMVFAAGLGFSDALGALAPPEVAIHLDWPNKIRVNGALCGRLRAAASIPDPSAQPDWLVVGLEIALRLADGQEPGADPDRTALSEEGCVEVEPLRLLESWSKHSLVWLNHWLDDGVRRLHTEWRTKAFGLGERVTIGDEHGTFVGLDEQGGLLLRQEDETRLIPLTWMLERQ